MDFYVSAKMVDKVFAFSLGRTFSREEAEELTQEILFQALNGLDRLQDETKFEPWFWQLANNTLKVFRRSKARSRSCFYFDDIVIPPYEDEYAFETSQEYQSLRKQIASLSASYREILVMHYYDNLTCKEISHKLCLPEGTVTYRLSVARKKLKKGYESMDKTALKPVRLEIGIAGEGNYDGAERPFPWQYISDALSQNILWYAYREPKTVEELSELTGVPAFYIEDSIINLSKREAVIRPTKSTVQTDFLIFDEQIYRYEQACANQCAEDVSEEFYLCAQRLTEHTLSMGIYTADKSFDELLCLFSLLTLDYSVPKYPPAKYRQAKVRYDGHRWEYLAQATHAVNEGGGLRMIDMDKNMNGWVPESYSHYVYRFSSFLSQKMMYDHEIAVCAALLQGNTLSDGQKETAAAMVINVYLKRDQDKIIVSMPVFTAEQYTKFRELTSAVFHEFLPFYQEKIRRYVAGYIKLFPGHLKEAATRNGFHIFVSMFARIAAIWMRQGKINLPDGAVCDVLIEHSH